MFRLTCLCLALLMTTACTAPEGEFHESSSVFYTPVEAAALE